MQVTEAVYLEKQRDKPSLAIINRRVQTRRAVMVDGKRNSVT